MSTQVDKSVNEASESVAAAPVDGEVAKRNLTIQSNEFAHGLQKVAYRLNKAVQNVKEHSKPLQAAAQHLSTSAHDILQSIHEFNPADLKQKVREALHEAADHARDLVDIDVSHQEGHHVAKAIQTLLKTVQKLEINAKFLGKTKEDIRTAIDEGVKRIADALEHITVDDEKTTKAVTDQLHMLNDIIDAIIGELEDFIEHTPEDAERLKTLKEVDHNLDTIRVDVRSAVSNHAGLEDVKQHLSADVVKVADEIKKLVPVEEGDEASAKARDLDKVTKAVLIEGVAGAKNLATHLEAIGKKDQ